MTDLRKTDLDMIELTSAWSAGPARVSPGYHDVYERDVRLGQISRFRQLLKSTPRAVCPYLGFKGDRDTHTSFPSKSNCCHSNARPESVRRFTQQSFCLNENYYGCTRFLGQIADQLTDNGQSKRANRSQVHKLIAFLTSLR